MVSWTSVVVLTVMCVIFLTARLAHGATYGQECNAVSNTCSDSNTDCYIEDCYKCRCQSGYTYNSGTGVCDQSSSAVKNGLVSVVTIVTASIFLTLL